MKRIKWILKRIIIAYLIFYIVLSSASTCFARGYDASCGEYVSQYAKDFIEEYCTPETNTTYDCSFLEPEKHWGGGAEFKGTFNACCSTGVYYMYKLALGINLYEYDFHGMCDDSVTSMSNSPYWENVTNQTLQPGDIVINVSHTEMYIGDNQNANFGNSPHSGKITNGPCVNTGAGGPRDFTHAFRLKNTVDVDPMGKVRGGSSSVNYSNFFFNGVPDGKYSLAKRSFWQVIIDTLAQILDFLINLLFYIVRAVIVGYTAIMESLLSWIINVVSDTNVEDKSLDISSTEASTSDSDTKITVDKILFNKLELFDINVFRKD